MIFHVFFTCFPHLRAIFEWENLFLLKIIYVNVAFFFATQAANIRRLSGEFLGAFGANLAANSPLEWRKKKYGRGGVEIFRSVFF